MKKIIPIFIKDFLKKHISSEDELNGKFYSQSGEDAIASRLFLDFYKTAKKGFYVDLGGYHPIDYSNTFLFYQLGWSGIVVEANHKNIDLFHKYRPADNTLNIGVGEKEGNLTFYSSSKQPEINSFSKEYFFKCLNDQNDFKETTCPVLPVNTILNQIPKDKELDLLSVDIEGLDLQILRSLDWEKHKPKVVIAEGHCQDLNKFCDHEINLLLKSKGYICVGKTMLDGSGSSFIFTTQERLDILTGQ